MTILLWIWAFGAVINALVMANIWDDLKSEGRLDRVRMTAVVFFIAASVLTWVYAIGSLIVTLLRSLFKRGGDGSGR